MLLFVRVVVINNTCKLMLLFVRVVVINHA